MKNTILILTLALASTGISFGQFEGQSDAGIFGSGVILTGTGVGAANSGVTTVYALNMGDNPDLEPTGDSYPISAQFGTGTSANPTFSLGTFTAGSTLILNGGSLLTYTNSGATQVAGGQDLNYNIFSSSFGSGFSSVALTADGSPGGVSGNTLFDNTTSGINLLAGLAPGTYTLDIYLSSAFTDPNAPTGQDTSGTFYDQPMDSDYGATFTVEAGSVPEPGSISLLLVGIGGLLVIQRRISKSRKI